MSPGINILIVADNFSMKMGGEASFPTIYSKLFQARGANLWIMCHERVRGEVSEALPELRDFMRFVEDSAAIKGISRLGRLLPYRVNDLIVGSIVQMLTQRRSRQLARDLIRETRIDVIFQPTPISPKAVSYMYDLGVPVVIGPMCGGMSFPPAFRDMDSTFSRLMIAIGRMVSPLAHRMIPGKLRADALLVANDRTAAALPAGCRGRVIRVVESGVDLSVWSDAGRATIAGEGGTVRFVFSGRFVDWKGIEFLVAAFLKVREKVGHAVLDLIGDGELGPKIRAMCSAAELKDHVRFHGWLSRQEAARVIRVCDVFVMPSLRECGGGAILEALAMGKPVIAANWGGPGDYVNETCGIRVEPSSREAYIDGLADAMIRLARSQELRASMGHGGRERIREEYFEWEAKGDRVFKILGDVANRADLAREDVSDDAARPRIDEATRVGEAPPA